MAAWVDEPVLADIMSRASLDEAGHAREFIHYARRRLAAHPNELPSELETLNVNTTEDRIKHHDGVIKGELAAVKDHDTIDTGFEMFVEKVAGQSRRARPGCRTRSAARSVQS